MILPWWTRWAALAGLLLAGVAFGYVKGAERGERRLEAFQAKVAGAAHQQDLRAAAAVARASAITTLLEEDHETEARRLRLERNAALLRMRELANSRIVPAVSHPAGRPDGEACYDAPALERGIRGDLDRAAGRLAGLLQRGDEAVMLQAFCSKWLNEQVKINGR